VSLVIVRSKFWGRRLLDQLAFVPHSIPGMAMGPRLAVDLPADRQDGDQPVRLAVVDRHRLR